MPAIVTMNTVPQLLFIWHTCMYTLHTCYLIAYIMPYYYMYIWNTIPTPDSRVWLKLPEIVYVGGQSHCGVLLLCYSDRSYFQQDILSVKWINADIDRRHQCYLTHWGRETHICVSKITIIGSDDGLSPGRRNAIIWTNAGILLFIRTLHDCPSQMNENLLISNSKLTSDSELIWWR